MAYMQGSGAVLFLEGGRDLEDVPACAQGFLGFSGDCNKERPFLHVKPAFKTQDCPWYDRGFCKHGEALMERGLQGIVGVSPGRGGTHLPKAACGLCPLLPLLKKIRLAILFAQQVCWVSTNMSAGQSILTT